MARPPISSVSLSESLTLHQCHDGFWLWDDTQGMNLAMREKTAEAAFTRAIEYYQEHLKRKQEAFVELSAHVDHFVGQLRTIEDDPFEVMPCDCDE